MRPCGPATLQATDERNENKASKLTGGQLKAINQSETLRVEVEQLVRDVRSAVGIKTVTESRVQKLESRMSRALERKNVEVLTADCIDAGDASMASSGMQELDKLQQSSKILAAAGTVVRALNSKDTAQDPCVLVVAIASAQSAGLALPTLVFEALISRAVNSAAADKDYDRFAMLLNPNCDSQTKFLIADMGVWRLPVEGNDDTQRAAIMKEEQEKRVMGLLMKMLRSEAEFSELRDMLSAVVAHAGLVDDKLKSECSELAVALGILENLQPESSADRLQSARAVLVSDSALVSKTLLVFPSGQKIVKQIDDILRQSLNDSASTKDLDAAVKVARDAASRGSAKDLFSIKSFVARWSPARKSLETFEARCVHLAIGIIFVAHASRSNLYISSRGMGNLPLGC